MKWALIILTLALVSACGGVNYHDTNNLNWQIVKQYNKPYNK